MSIAVKNMSKAFMRLMIAHPFFASIGMRLDRTPIFPDDPKAKEFTTFATDGGSIRYNTEFTETLTVPQIQGVIVHEIMHIINLHHLRKGERDAEKWNVACDLAINPTIIEMGFELPEHDVRPEFDNMSAEQIYRLLEDAPPKKPSFDQLISPASGTDQGDGPGNPAPGTGPSESQIKMWVNQAAIIAQQAGKLPSFIERFIEEINTPTQEWRTLLMNFLTERSPRGMSWRHPNRRYIAQDLYLPGKMSAKDGHVVVVVDTSGSLGQEELAEFGAEIQSLREQLSLRLITVIYCDAAINRVETFTRDQPLTLHAVGGGGTSFYPPFEWLQEQGIQPAALVYLTDGYGTGFPEASFPVLWAINNNKVIPTSGIFVRLTR